MDENFIDVFKVLGISENTTKEIPSPILQEQKPRFVRLEQDEKDLECMRCYIRQQAQNTAVSQALRANITKGILQGEQPYKLLLKALECVSLMTGDNLFYNENKEQLKVLYTTLEYKPAMDAELIEIETRINKIIAYKKENALTIEENVRLSTALKWHKDKARTLNLSSL